MHLINLFENMYNMYCCQYVIIIMSLFALNISEQCSWCRFKNIFLRICLITSESFVNAAQHSMSLAWVFTECLPCVLTSLAVMQRL